MATMGFIQNEDTTVVKKSSSILVPETFTHSIAFGETGAGKTSSYIYANLQERLRLGHGVLLYDYKGKEHLSVKSFAHHAKRLDDVIEIGKPWGESINLIQNMDEDALDKFFDVILKHGKDSQYWQNSAKSLAQTILKVLKGIEDMADELKEFDSVNEEVFEVDGTYVANAVKYPTVRNLDSLVQVCKTFESLKDFISNLPNLEAKLLLQIRKSLKMHYANEGETKALKEKLFKVLTAQERLKIIIEDNKNSLDSFGEDSNENLTQNIMGSMTAPLLSLSQNSSFNTNSLDIVKALNAGKIIIINVESLSNSVVESLSNSVLYELSKRTKSIHINPISIFIDEVQRVVSEKSDIPIDVLREAKVDMFLATQNSALLKDKLEEEKFDALMGNLTRKFYYKSSANEEIETENELSYLESFEYVSSEDNYSEVHTAKPYFLDNSVKMKIEFMYQKSLNVLENFLYKYKGTRVILEYDARLYRDNKLIVLDIKTQKEYILESLSKSNIEHFEAKIGSLFASVKRSFKDDKSVEELLAS